MITIYNDCPTGVRTITRKILITGADGFLGSQLIRLLLNTTAYEIVGVTYDAESLRASLSRVGVTQQERVSFVSNDRFVAEGLEEAPDAAVHLAFSRARQPAKDIASSIDFAASTFARLAEMRVPRVIYVSSQGVYGAAQEWRTEETVVAPTNPYTMAKYAAEVLFRAFAPQEEGFDWTALRLDLVAQSQNVFVALCKQALAGEIKLTGGNQQFSFIDAADAVGAMAALLGYTEKWDGIYNIGWCKKRYSLLELAETIAQAAAEYSGQRPAIVLEEKDIALWAGMDSSLFTRRTGWQPTITLKDTAIAFMRDLS